MKMEFGSPRPGVREFSFFFFAHRICHNKRAQTTLDMWMHLE